MTSSGYLCASGLLFALAAWNSTRVYVINWRKVAMAFCVLTVAVGVGLVAGVVL